MEEMNLKSSFEVYCGKGETIIEMLVGEGSTWGLKDIFLGRETQQHNFYADIVIQYWKSNVHVGELFW